MKALLKSFFSPIRFWEYIELLALYVLNMLFLLYMIPLLFIIMFGAVEVLQPVDELIDSYAITVILAKGLPAIILSIAAGALINQLRVWLLSLPIQFLLYTVGMYVMYDSQIAIGDAMSMSECAQTAGILLLIQLPGVAIGLLFRYLIRKLRARKLSI